MSIKIKSEEEIIEEARVKFLDMMHWKSICERLEPLMIELIWILKGSQNEAEHKKTLPDYCYSILALFKRTIFKVVPTHSEILTIKDKNLAASGKSIEDSKRCLEIDWEKFGAVIGSEVRCFRFLEFEVEPMLEQDGLLDLEEKDAENLSKWVFGRDWVEKKTAEMEAQDRSKSLEEIVEKQWTALEEYSKASISKWNDLAYQWGPDAMTLLNRGIARGTSGLLDERGAIVGEGKLKLIHTHVFLLIVWPEIQEMISANPPKTRNDLWDWLTPFSHANWLEIKDLEQLNRLCDSIRLKLKKPGAPLKGK